ncbi:MAG TPA: hypothetical protein VG737_01720 [Cyclobacteriaceae bacterium]|nr:hypothetical protein [Cyclobacteriaceae bacterium]
MEQLTREQDDRLLDYLDGRLDGTGLAQLKKDLESSAAMQLRLEELRIVHRTLAHIKLDAPSPMFTEKVMKNLHTAPPASSLSPRNGLFLLAGVIVAAGILIALMGSGVFDGFSEIVKLDSAVSVKQFQPAIPEVSVNGRLVIKILIGLNLALAFVVLDRTILKPYFQKKAGLQL